jgi:Heparinase II/III-like protein
MTFRTILAIVTLTALLPSWALAAALVGPWKADQTHHPRLLWEEDEWDGIVARLDREPYATLYARVKSRSNGGISPAPPYNDPRREYSNANLAKNAAFVWAVEGDTAKAEKAAQALETLETEYNWPDISYLLWLLDYDIHTAEAMQGYCAAYDILAGTGALDPTRLQEIRDRLETMLINCWNFYLVDFYIYRQTLSIANHFSKMAFAFGTAAITLNDSEYALEWINHAMGWGTQRLFGMNTTDEGTYVEGPGYHVYTLDQYLPFFLQYQKFTGGESATFQRRHCGITGKNCWYNSHAVTNPLDNPKMHALAQWSVDVRLPDGRCPPFDDSFSIGTQNGLFAGAWQDGEFAWDWLTAEGAVLYTKYIADNTADMICWFDDTITPVEPGRGPSLVYPQDGFVIFRSDWGPDAIYAMFEAEGGMSRTMGGGHEHADNLSFMLYAGGTPLALDTGYIKYEERDKTAKGIDHNIISIDNAGPPSQFFNFGGVDAKLTAFDLTESPQWAVGITPFQKTDWTRAFFFYGNFALVADYLDSDSAHTYRYLLHGNGGGDTAGTFEMASEGARWEIEGEALTLTVAATGTIHADSYDDWHAFAWSQGHTHEVYRGRINGIDAGFASALVPDSANEPTVSVFEDPTTGNSGLVVDTGSVIDYLVTDDGDGPTMLPIARMIGVEDGTAWVRPVEDRALVLGRSLYVDGERLAHQIAGHSMLVKWGDGWVEMTPDTAEGNLLSVVTWNSSAVVTGACVTDVHFVYNFTAIKFDEPCTVRVEY